MLKKLTNKHSTIKNAGVVTRYHLCNGFTQKATTNAPGLVTVIKAKRVGATGHTLMVGLLIFNKYASS